jgi:hypothetical protein
MSSFRILSINGKRVLIDGKIGSYTPPPPEVLPNFTFVTTITSLDYNVVSTDSVTLGDGDSSTSDTFTHVYEAPYESPVAKTVEVYSDSINSITFYNENITSVDFSNTNSTVGTIYLNGNDLTSFPDISNQTTITNLDLGRNFNMSGSIPEYVGDIDFSYNFAVYQCDLSGTIPDSFYKNSNLQYLRLDDNSFTGSLNFLSGLTSLKWFYGHNNDFSGPINSLAALTQMTLIQLNSNTNLTGDINFISTNTNLQTLSVPDCGFSGIPFDISNFTSLTNYNISNNSFSGNLDFLSGNTTTTTINIGSNDFSGDIADLSGMIGTNNLTMTDNQGLSSSLSFISNLPTQIQKFHATTCSFSGTPPTIDHLTSISEFNLGYNSGITGWNTSDISVSSITYFSMEGCSLTENAVDQILADFVTNLSFRPDAGQIRLAGGTNSAPSAAGIIDMDLIVDHGWSVLINV